MLFCGNTVIMSGMYGEKVFVLDPFFCTPSPLGGGHPRKKYSTRYQVLSPPSPLTGGLFVKTPLETQIQSNILNFWPKIN